MDHPYLAEHDSESIRAFLRRYDQYCREVEARARQLVDGSSTTEVTRPANLKFCVDAEFLESKIALGFIEDVKDFASLTDAQLRTFLEERSKESKTVVTLDKLDSIVESDLRTNMKETSASTRMEDLFTSYHTILSRHALKWIISDNQKVAVQHFLLSIRPNSLRERLESDLSFSHHELKKTSRDSWRMLLSWPKHSSSLIRVEQRDRAREKRTKANSHALVTSLRTMQIPQIGAAETN